MLRKYSEVLDIPVICADTGKKAGIVKDILFSTGDRRVKALLLEQKGLTMKKRVVFLNELLSLGSDAAIVNSSICISELERASFKKAFEDEGSLIGLKVYSRAGGEVGIVKDVIFDCQTGRIEGFEISDGLLQDVLQGRKVLPLFGRVELGKEIAVVGTEAVEEMKETGGGIRNRLR